MLSVLIFPNSAFDLDTTSFALRILPSEFVAPWSSPATTTPIYCTQEYPKCRKNSELSLIVASCGFESVCAQGTMEESSIVDIVELAGVGVGMLRGGGYSLT